MENLLWYFRIIFWGIIGISIVGIIIATQRNRLKNLSLPNLSGAIPKGVGGRIKEHWKAVVGFIGAHIAVYVLFPGVWGWFKENPLHMWSWFALVLTHILFRGEGKVVRGRKIPGELVWPAGWIIIILIAGNIYHAFGKISPLLEGPRSVLTATTRTSSDELRNLPRPGENEEGKKFATDFWMKNLEEEEAKQMIEITFKESGFNQFEVDGRTPYRNREVTDAVGIMQIRENVWAPFARGLELDLYRMEDNLQMALWIRKHCGPDEWSASGLQKDGCAEFVFAYPPLGEEWSEPIPWGRPQGFNWRTSTGVRIQLEDGRVIEDHPTEPTEIPYGSRFVRFQSKGAEAGKVTVQYQ